MLNEEYYSLRRPGLVQQVDEYLNIGDVKRSKDTLEEIKQLDESYYKDDLRKQGKYLSFKDLFEDVILYDLIEAKNEGVKDAQFNLFYLYFDEWLKNKNESIDNPDSLTKEKFLNFYKDYEADKDLSVKKFEEEKQSWHINKNNIEDKKEDKKAIKSKRGILTYKWQGQKKDLNELYDEMKRIFIDKETRKENFLKVFDGVSTKEIEPLKLLSSNATELLYIIHKMMEGELIKKEKIMNYIRVKACFCKVDGSSFNENFKELYQQIKNGLSTERPDVIALIKRFQ